MRLINVETMQLEEFMGGGGQAPKYAILSHTWEDEEVTFQDFTSVHRDTISQKKGYGKIKKTCQQARKDGQKYAWVDTCCIDKTSSAELTEAINSMFQWYMDAVLCYVWLADLPSDEGIKPWDPNSKFMKGRWLTRGWTLQELIAPRQVEFYDQDWNLRGTKGELSVALSQATGISVEVLRDASLLYQLPIAQRMSWAATRQTTRIEDMAYCLLGIFDVNMPMMYGEGSKAFIRLQEEIAKESNDLSLFAWKARSPNQRYHGIFASTPAEFVDSGLIKLNNDPGFNNEFMMTNKGLRIDTELHSGKGGTYLLGLNCSQATNDHEQLGIWVSPHGGGLYSRTDATEFGVVQQGDIGKSTTMFISKRISTARSSALEGSHSHAFMFRHGFDVLNQPYTSSALFCANFIQPKSEWDSQRRMFITHGASAFVGCTLLIPKPSMLDKQDKRVRSGNMFMIVFGKTEGSKEPWLTIVVPESSGDVFQHLHDLKKLGAAASRNIARSVRLKDGPKETWTISVSLENILIDKEVVHCIDIIYSDPSVDKPEKGEGRRGSH
ncbi:HET domain protein [Leptodontidium sp. 2 PMI_412]|nr:HET domain protein [Leptodontidium sp. 2 PMI_412]